MKSMYLVSVGSMLNGSEVDSEVLSQVELAPKFVFDDLKSARDCIWDETRSLNSVLEVCYSADECRAYAVTALAEDDPDRNNATNLHAFKIDQVQAY